MDLCKRLGLADQLVQTNPAYRRTFVVRHGRLHRLPDGFLMMAPTRLWPLAVTPILSPLGKLRAALEYFIPPRTDDGDESMAAFVRRRLGREVFDRLVEPLVSAVYAADMEKLSVLATLSRFREMEREHGSLIRAMRQQMKNRPKAGRRKRRPLQHVRHAARRTVEPGRGDRRAAAGRRRATEYAGRADRTPRRRLAGVDDRIDALQRASASPADQSLIFRRPDPRHALARGGASCCGRSTPSWPPSWRRSSTPARPSSRWVTTSRQIGHPLDGMGAVVPAIEHSPILASVSAAGSIRIARRRARTLLRVFVGGARRPELAEMDDEQLLPLVLDELARLLRIRGEPCYCEHRPLARHDAAVPRGPQGAGGADRGPRGGAAATWRWPATPITAWACPTASMVAARPPSRCSPTTTMRLAGTACRRRRRPA